MIVSFVGSTGYRHPHVFADSACRYDWGCLKGLHAVMVIRPGIDVGHAMVAIFETAELMHSYPAVVDIDQQHLAFLVGSQPLQLWPVKPDTELWRDYFS